MNSTPDYSYERSRLLAAAGTLGPPPGAGSQVSGLMQTHGYTDPASRLSSSLGRAPLPGELSQPGTPGLMSPMSSTAQYSSRFLPPSLAMHGTGCDYPALMSPYMRGGAGAGPHPLTCPALDPHKSLAPTLHPFWGASSATTEGYPQFGINPNVYSPYLSLISASENLPVYSHSMAASALHHQPSAATYHRIYDLHKEALYHGGQGMGSPSELSGMHTSMALSHLGNQEAAVASLGLVKREPGTAEQMSGSCDHKSRHKSDAERTSKCVDNSHHNKKDGRKVLSESRSDSSKKVKVKTEHQKDINSNNKCSGHGESACCSHIKSTTSGHVHKDKVKGEIHSDHINNNGKSSSKGQNSTPAVNQKSDKNCAKQKGESAKAVHAEVKVEKEISKGGQNVDKSPTRTLAGGADSTKSDRCDKTAADNVQSTIKTEDISDQNEGKNEIIDVEISENLTLSNSPVSKTEDANGKSNISVDTKDTICSSVALSSPLHDKVLKTEDHLSKLHQMTKPAQSLHQRTEKQSQDASSHSPENEQDHSSDNERKRPKAGKHDHPKSEKTKHKDRHKHQSPRSSLESHTPTKQSPQHSKSSNSQEKSPKLVPSEGSPGAVPITTSKKKKVPTATLR